MVTDATDIVECVWLLLIRRLDLLVVGLCFFQAEDGIRDLVRSRGLGDVYKRQAPHDLLALRHGRIPHHQEVSEPSPLRHRDLKLHNCLLYTSDAADERSSVDLGGRRIIKKNTQTHTT